MRYSRLILMCLATTSVVEAGYVEEVLRDNPVAYWRLGEKDLDAPIVDQTSNVTDGAFLPNGDGLQVDFDGAIAGDPDTATRFSTTVGFGCGDCGVVEIPVGGVLDLGTTENALFSLEAWFQILPSVNDKFRATGATAIGDRPE